jgi:hypothetical protein
MIKKIKARLATSIKFPLNLNEMEFRLQTLAGVLVGVENSWLIFSKNKKNIIKQNLKISNNSRTSQLTESGHNFTKDI